MHQKIAKLFRLPALLLAAALQIMPIARAALPAAQATANVLAIVFRWAAGAAAALGGVQAVSGASTVITSPLSTNIVQGKLFVMRLTTAPDQAHAWTASNLPAGIKLIGTNGNAFWQLNGTPTVSGTYVVGLTAKDQANSSSSRTVTASLTLNIAPAVVAAPPLITNQPASLSVTQGQTATFSVGATGTAPLTYFWRKGGNALANGPNPSLNIPNAQSANAGTYSVIVSNSAGTVTSSNATLTVIVPPTPPTITTQPGDQLVNVVQNATFSVVATGSTPLNYFWRKGATVLTNSASPSFTIANAQSADAGTYSVIVSNSVGTVTSSNATLTVNTVIIAPAITTQPTNQLVFPGQNVSFAVAASGTAPFDYQWRKNGANLADNTRFTGALSNRFAISGVLTNDAGNYTVVVANSSGSVTSQVAVLTVTNPLVSTLTVQIIGSGSVSPNYNGQSLTIGNTYTMTATPGAGCVFSKWTGSLFSTSASLTFVMQNNFVLQANFIVSPLIALKGTYHGLFYDTNSISQLNSGFVMVTLTDAGAFTGSLQIGSSKWPFKGQTDANGNATVAVNRGGRLPLTLELQLDMSGGSDQIAGTVTISDNSWTSELTADRIGFDARTNPCPAAGTYTLVIPGTPGAINSPAGDGFGIVKVTTAGKVTLSGVLADGTSVSQSGTLTESGQWALYAPLYVGRGSVLGWLTFTNTPGGDIDGWVRWIRPVQPSIALYTMGFGVVTEAIGSQYIKPPAGTRVLDFTNGIVIFSYGNLSEPFTNQVQLSANGRIVNLSDNGLSLNVNTRNGMFSGRAQDPATGKYHSFKGIVLQKQNAGGGYFLNQYQSGEVFLGP
jgi:hypothetical protein